MGSHVRLADHGLGLKVVVIVADVGGGGVVAWHMRKAIHQFPLYRPKKSLRDGNEGTTDCAGLLSKLRSKNPFPPFSRR